MFVFYVNIVRRKETLLLFSSFCWGQKCRWMFVYIRHPYYLFLHLNFSRKPHWTNYNFNKQFKKQRWWNISVNATLTQRKEEGATKKREKPVRRLWGSIKKLNLNSGESEVGDEKKSVRRRFRSWRCCQTLRKEESAIKKSRQSDQISEEEVKLWSSGRKPRKERIPKKRQNISFLNHTQPLSTVDTTLFPQKPKPSQKQC